MAHLLKRMYSQRRVQNLVYQDNPLLALIPKKQFRGASEAITVRHVDPMGRSAAFATAQANISPNKGVQFLLTTVADYQLYAMSFEAILAGRGDAATLLSTLDTEVSGSLNNASRSLAIQLYGSGSGKVGKIATAGITGEVITLSNANDVTNFEVGQVIVADTGTEGGALRDSGDSATIAAVDRSAGTITFATGGVASINGLAAADNLYIKGDAQNNGDAVRLSGLEAWNPVTAPSATTFFNVARNVDPDRLGGIRLDISSYNPEEGLVVAMSRVARDGGRPSHLFINYVDARNTQLALGSKVETQYSTVGDIGFSRIRVMGPKGDVMIHPDQNAPSGVGRLLQLDTWALMHRGELLNIQDLDGNTKSRQFDADGYEGRISFYGQLACDAPGFNARLVMPS
jgi:hypothetical protein